jgi:formate hydrogenlyase transcriptional activator
MVCSYSWPGNIRELQNVAERSMVLCDGDTFMVDEHWLLPELHLPSTRILNTEVQQFERSSIEQALAKCNGKVSGPLGAAAVLGIPSSTLESKLKALKINKHNFVR